MESAGRAAADIVGGLLEDIGGTSALVLCGRGNNGGDGLVVARQLATHGFTVTVVLLGRRDELSDDCSKNLDLLIRMIEGSASPDVIGDAGVDVAILSLEEWNQTGRSPAIM